MAWSSDIVVGIVIVSHSAALARGVAELAREMAGPDVTVEVAGGMDGDGSALGTDAVLVMAAIEAAYSADGVLVLMDLGSAVLSAETALEMLDPEVAANVVLSDAPLVEGAVSAAAAARLGLTLVEVAAEAGGGLEGKRQHLGPAAAPAPAPASAPAPGGEQTLIVVGNRLGLHARPAARFVATAGRFDAEVTVTNVTTGRGPAGGRSVNGLATLGVRQGQAIVVRATGPEANAALAALVALANDDFGDRALPPPPPAPAPVAGKGPGLAGLPASAGIAVGPARHLRSVVPPVPTGPAEDPAQEWDRLQQALHQAGTDIAAARAATAVAAGAEEAAIFDAHLLYLEDDALLGPARRAVLEDGDNAAHAWHAAVDSVAASYRALDDDYLQARAADVIEVGDRVLRRLLGAGTPQASPADAGVVVTTEATAGDLAELDLALVTGLATAAGGPLGHGAILARTLGIPAVVGLGPSILAVGEGTLLAVDGDAGAVHVDPEPELVARLTARRSAEERRRSSALQSANEPAITRDGVRILVEANAGSAHEGPTVVATGSDGVGLLRTEFLFLDRDTAPDEDEQYRAYLELASALGGRPLVVRTLDAGGDKPAAWVQGVQAAEENPALGLRGLRLGLARPEVLLTQLRAVLRVAAGHPVRLMFPMVTTVDEVRRAKALLAEAAETVARRGQAVPERMPVGIMVEVPAAALRTRHLAREVDFLSIGTNDLTQYALAVDRGNSRVAPLGDGLDPAVLGLIDTVVRGAAPRELPVAVCGALAADPRAVPVLVGLGVTRLSVPSAAVPTVKQAVRDVDAGAAKELAARLLSLESAAAVRAALDDGSGE